jgi:hypothetical protein
MNQPKLWGAQALMEWLGENMPTALKVARSFPGHRAFHEYMRTLTGVVYDEWDYESHGEACEAYLHALKDKSARGNHSPMIAAGSEEKLASVKVCEEPKREPLDWNKPTSIDRFPGFISTTSVAWDELSKPEASHSHPLQKMAEGKEGFGSAALLKVR